MLHACNRAGRLVTRFVGDVIFIFPTCRHTHWSLVQNFASLLTRVNVILSQALRSRFTCKCHTRNDPRRHATHAHVCGSKLSPSRKGRSSMVRSIRLSNKGVPMFCPFAKAQERHCGSMFVSIFGKYSTGEPRCQKRPRSLPRASFWLRTPKQRCASNDTEYHASKSPAGCFESTTRFSVFLRVEGDMAFTVISAMQASRLEWQELCADARC